MKRSGPSAHGGGCSYNEGNADAAGTVTGRILCAWVLWAVLLQCPLAVQAFALTDVSGNVGYTFRSLDKTNSEDTVSNQLQGALNLKGYLYKPWVATADAGLRATWDRSEFDGNASTNETTITTGDLNLSVLPRSRTPFLLTYQASDSRVDLVSRASPLNTLGSTEFRTSRLSLKQSYFTKQGHRFQIRYDNNSWKQAQPGGEDYEDELFGAEMDLKMPGQTLIAKTSVQNTQRSVLDQKTDTFIFNIDHFYYPSRDLRVDTMANVYNSDYQSRQPLNSTNQPNSSTDLSQFSSFIFWRPQDRPLSISGGVRFYGLEGDTTGNRLELTNYSATGGLFYQYTRNLRLDANVDIVSNDNGEDSNVSSRGRAGALYQSDIHNLFSGFNYQWYGQGSLSARNARERDDRAVLLKLGHDLQRLWRTGPTSSLRLSLSQVVSDDEQFGDVNASIQRLDHSGSLSWDSSAQGGMSFLQLTLSDARNFGDDESDQQFVNFQAQRTQILSRLSNLTGNLTVQYVSQGFNGRGDNDRVTGTGQVNYTHSAVFGVPRLRFLSDLRISRTDVANNVDRLEWENRLNYTIGMTEARFSWRYFDLSGDAGEDQQFNLIYFQVTRRF